MKIFNLDNDFNIVCNWQKTRSGFKHTASLHKNGLTVYECKICYLNRTWECFEYESILLKVVNSYFDHNQKDNYSNIIKELRG
jgi:hypothetical protein